MMIYNIGQTSERVILTPPVLAHFEKYKQNRPWKREAGGQLFAEFNAKDIIVTLATGPRSTDLRKRTLYVPDKAAEQREINNEFNNKRYYIGDWHTHPERYPTPSLADQKSFESCFERSKHKLGTFLFIIVGQETLPDGLYLGLCNENGIEQLK